MFNFDFIGHAAHVGYNTYVQNYWRRKPRMTPLYRKVCGTERKTKSMKLYPSLYTRIFQTRNSFLRLVAGFPPRRPGFDPRSGYVGFVVDKVALGQVFSEYFGFPCQSSFHRLLYNHHQSSGAGTIGQEWPTYQVDSVSPHPEKLKKNSFLIMLVNHESSLMPTFLFRKLTDETDI
jgi:hypothetical protein